MKTYLNAVLISLLLAISSSCGSSKEFSSLDYYDNIDIVHIPKGVGWMIGSVASIDDKDAGKILKGFKSITIVDCQGMKGRKEIMKCVKDAIDSDRSELILETHDGTETTLIYGHIDDRSMKLKNLLIVSEEASELSVIRAKGTFDIRSVLNEQTRQLP